MSIYIRKAESEEFKKNIEIVKKMTRGMNFDENMGKVNWRFKMYPMSRTTMIFRGSKNLPDMI